MQAEPKATPSDGAKRRAMILSVGGSAAPVVVSLNTQRPEYVCFFVSQESKASLTDGILSKLDYRPVHYDWIETASAEDLVACYLSLARGLPPIAGKWNLPLKDFVADYTGGTKTMSVALALATVQAVGQYTYIGGVERTKEGLGVVVDGKERMLHQANPWDALAISSRRRASLLFARGRFEAAAEQYDEVTDRVSPGEQGLYQALASLARGYAEWDRFAHRRAQDLLFRSLRTLEPFSMGLGDRAWSDLVATLRRHAEWLPQMGHSDKSHLRVADLIANAKRRGDLEARYDDAVARLYSALEMAARIRLHVGHGIRTSSASKDQIPASLREEFCRLYTAAREDGTPCLKLPHYAAFRLLGELRDDLASRYFAREKAIKSLLDQRNGSILAHGDRPVGENVYGEFLPLVCEVAGITEAELPRFPLLPP